MLAPARVLARWYDGQLVRHPIRTKTVTSTTLFAVGDGLAQINERRRGAAPAAPSWDACRAARLAAFGCAVAAPAHFWLNALDRVVTRRGAAGVAAKVAADQLLWTPPMTASFFVVQSALRGRSAGDALADARAALPSTLAANWCVWPAIHAVTFSAIPLRWRLPWINACSCLWTAVLSARVHDAEPAGVFLWFLPLWDFKPFWDFNVDTDVMIIFATTFGWTWSERRRAV